MSRISFLRSGLVVQSQPTAVSALKPLDQVIDKKMSSCLDCWLYFLIRMDSMNIPNGRGRRLMAITWPARFSLWEPGLKRRVARLSLHPEMLITAQLARINRFVDLWGLAFCFTVMGLVFLALGSAVLLRVPGRSRR